MITNRQKLINMVQGKPAQHYTIVYSVDIKRNITIWTGAPLKHRENNINIDWFVRYKCEIGNYSHFLPVYYQLNKMEDEVAESLTRDELLTAFWDFRKVHPLDGWGGSFVFFYHEENAFDGWEKGMRYDRDDEKQVADELIRRNREYIKELWGVDLSGYPLDFDFAKEWERRSDEFRKKYGWDRQPTDEELWAGLHPI